jgi:glutamate synthase domain-containing protein 3
MHAARVLDYSSSDVYAFSLSILSFAPDRNQRLNASAFLSAIIAAGKESEYSIVLNHTDSDFPYLGYNNAKNVTIIGDVDSIGEEMKAGSITVHGWGGHVGQNMTGGCVIIEGDCECVGNQMKGGDVIVRGSIRPGPKWSGGYCGIGLDTHCGRITVAGDCEACQNVSTGEISIGGNVKEVGMRNDGAIIRIGGSVTESIGRWMWDGEIHVEGDIPKLITEFGGGKIYHKGRLVVDYPKVYPGNSDKTIELP